MNAPRSTAAALMACALAVVLLAGCSAEPPGVRSPVASAPLDAPGGGGGAEVAADKPVTLAFIGDVHFEGAFGGVPRSRDSTLGPLSRTLRSADLAVANLESALTRRGGPASKEAEVPSDRYWFRSAPSALDVFERSGVDVVSMANNHGADYGVTGIRDTVRAAGRSPVSVVGVGLNARQAFRPHRSTITGNDVAVFAADASPRESADRTWAVAPGSGPGLASARGRAGQLLAAVRESARVDDVTVVYLHWGEEFAACSTQPQEALARSLARAGADVVVGTHTHVLLGAGTLADAYVSYGLGNFFWYHGRTSETGVLSLTVQGGEVVDDVWTPGRIRAGGGAPRRLARGERPGAVADWRALRGCTNLGAGPGARSDRAEAPPAYAASVRRIGPTLEQRMRRQSPRGCPVSTRALRRLTMRYVGFDGRARDGEMVVHRGVADDVVRAFGAMYRDRFPIRRMELIVEYGGNDNRSMAANNTSAYNCRRVAGQASWSDHAYGRAIDINPVQNPFVRGDTVQPPAARPYLDADRSAGARHRPGVIGDGGVVRRVMAGLGWSWGGDYSDPDYQHFSAP